MIGEFTDDTNQVSLDCHTLLLAAHGCLRTLRIALGTVFVALLSTTINMLRHTPPFSCFAASSQCN